MIAFCYILSTILWVIKMLYFGYGSNLDKEDWMNWCGRRDGSKLVEITRCYAKGFIMRFNYYSNKRGCGAANLVYTGNEDHGTPGVLFEIDDYTLSLLDKKEGHPNSYQRVTIEVITEHNEVFEAITYISNLYSNDDFFAPSEEYYSLIENGLKSRGMEYNHLVKAERNEEPDTTNSLFVYGTLKSGESRNSLLGEQKIIPAKTKGILLDLDLYPGMINGNGEVNGQLFFLSKVRSTIEELDRIEGADLDEPLFTREIIAVKFGVNQLNWAFCYLYNRSSGDEKIIQSGLW